MDCVDRAHRLRASDLGGPVEAHLVDGHDVDALPVVAHRTPNRVTLDFEARSALAEREYLAECECGRAPVVVVRHRVEHDRARRPAEVASEQR